MKKQPDIALLAITVFIIMGLSAVIFLYNQNQKLKKIIEESANITSTPAVIYVTAQPTPTPSSTPTPKTSSKPASSPVACTLEAKLCPDGKSYVGRVGPNCEFAPCPTP